ncbi:MAG TPA: TonB-dependent receptor [Candidatus Sulfotelmatobacter sp.]|nr:TonB-dependent receptor [Candidatus Sulfotelmatobacter sp.]
MFRKRLHRLRFRFSLRSSIQLILLIAFAAAAASITHAQSANIRGKILDPLASPVAQAKVVAVRESHEDTPIANTTSAADGTYSLATPDSGRYAVRVEAAGFDPQTSAFVYISSNKTADIDVSLRIGTLSQQVVVSATGTPTLETQIGASVSVVDHSDLENQHQLNVADALRTLPGLQISQTGERGGSTSLFVRGGNSDFNKVLIDGIPANDIGGAFNFADLSSTAVDQVEILRGPNSVLYGPDAIASVVNITTPHGTTIEPEFNYSIDGGNFDTFRNEVSVSGAFHQFDYFSEFSRFDTHNSLPNSEFHDATYAGNFGWTPSATTDVRFTVRHTATGLGDSNALAFYGIPDDSFQHDRYTYWGATLQNQTTRKWHNVLKFASGQQSLSSDNPAPTGTPFDPFAGTPFDSGPNYLGDLVTIRGANGYSVTGQAILDFAGVYPSLFNSETTRRSFYVQSDYQLLSDLTVTGGFRYENENGFTNSNGSLSPADRNNYSTFLQANGNIGHRLFATAGVGFENNAVYGFAVTPRVSLAYYLRRPAHQEFFGDTKLKFNFGKGITEPSIFNQGASLFALLSGVDGGAGIIANDHISPVGPERSRSFDFGVEQNLLQNRARLGLTLFHNDYYNLIEFVSASALPLLGVPPDAVAAAQAAGGATINSDSFRALGAEITLDTNLGHGFRASGVYTYLAATVTKSFTGDALAPSTNPEFPDIPIGAFAPLVGARPFNRAPHTGGILLSYDRHRFNANIAGSFVGRRDGSTFLSDGFFGTTMLLPNRNLQDAYQLVALNARYGFNSHITGYVSATNLLSQHYQEVIGFPALPFAFRLGVKFTFGGDHGWK